MNRQNHSEPENRLTLEEQQEFLELLARLSPEPVSYTHLTLPTKA